MNVTRIGIPLDLVGVTYYSPRLAAEIPFEFGTYVVQLRGEPDQIAKIYNYVPGTGMWHWGSDVLIPAAHPHFPYGYIVFPDRPP